MVHVFNHEWDQAEGPLREADRLFVEIGSSYGINQTRFWRTQVFFGREEIERAKAEANLFVEYCQRVGEKNMQSTVLFFLGLIAELENDLQSTLYYSQKSLDLAKEVGSPDNLATIFVSLGRLKYLQGDFEVAIQ